MPRNKITIVIEDREDGTVHVDAQPNLMTMVSMTIRGPEATSMAVAYAMKALRQIALDSKAMKEKDRKSQLILPPGFDKLIS